MANKSTVDVQLRINTIFSNVESGVEKLKKQLATVSFGSSQKSDLFSSYETAAQEYMQTLEKIKNFDLTSGSTAEYKALWRELQTELKQVKSLQDQIKKTDVAEIVGSDQTAEIEKSKQAISGYEAEIAQLEAKMVEASNRVQTLSYNPELDGYKAAEAAFETYSNQAEEAKLKLAEERQHLAALETENDKYTASLAERAKQLEITAQVAETTNQLEEAGKRIKDENVEKTKAQAAADKELAEGKKKLKEQTDKETEAAKAADAQWSATSATFVSDFQRAAKASDGLTTALQEQLVKWTSFQTVVSVAKSAITDMIDTFKELDDNLAAISSVSGIDTGTLWSNMPQYIEQANELGLTIDDLTNGMLLFYQQGLDAVETEARLDAAGKMAAISQTDLATSVDWLTSAMNAFNMTGEDASHVTDVYSALAGATAVDVEELATAMSRTASIAQSAGMDFETTTAFLTTMEETTRLSAETIGTSMSSIIARFEQLKTAPDELLEDGTSANDVETALKSADVALRDANGEFRDLGDVLMELSSKWNDLDTNTQRYIATIGAGTRQQSNFIALMANYDKNVANIATATNSAGAAEQQFTAINKSLSAEFNRLDNSWKALQTSWLNGAGVISTVVGLMSDLLMTLSKIPSILQLAGVAAAVFAGKLLLVATSSDKVVATQKLFSVIDTTCVNSKQKLTAANYVLNAAQKKYTASILETQLAQEGLTKEEAEAIASAYKEATANGILKGSLDALKTSLLKVKTGFFAIMSTPVGQFLAIVTAAVVALGIASVASKAQLNSFGNALNSASKRVEELSQVTNELQSSASSVKEYVSSLESAHDAGEDLSDIRQKIYDAGVLEESGVDALTASYDELKNALEEVTAAKQLAADKSFAEQLEAENEKLQTLKDALAAGEDSGLFDSGGYTITSGNGKSGYQAEEYAKQVLAAGGNYAPTDEQVAAKIDELYEGTWTLKIGDQETTFDDYADFIDYKKKIDEQVAEQISISEAEQLTRVARANEDNANTALINDSSFASILRYYNDNIGEALDGETLTPEFNAYADSIERNLQQLSNSVNVDASDFTAFVNGTFSNLTQDQIDAFVKQGQELDNSVENLSPAEQTWIDAANQYEEKYKNLIDSINRDYTDNPIISDEVAEELSYSALEKIQDTLETSGPDAARTIVRALSGELNEVFEDVDIDSADLNDAISSALDSSIEDLNIDTSSIGAAVSDLTELWASGAISATDYIQALQYIAESASGSTEKLMELANSITISEEDMAAMSDVSETWANLGDNLSIVQNLIGETGASLEELTTLATALGTTVDEMIGSGGLSQIGDKFYANADAANEWANSLIGLTDSELANAQAEYEHSASVKLNAASQAEAAAAEAEAAATKADEAAAQIDAGNNVIDNDAELVTATMDAAKAQQQFNIQADGTSPALEEVAANAQRTSAYYSQLATRLRDAASDLREYAADQKSSAEADTNKANYIKSLRSELTSAQKDWQNYGKTASNSGGGGSSSAADGVDEATSALEAQKEALEEAIDGLESYKSELEDQKQALEDEKEALEDLNDALKETLELYIDLITSRLEDEIDHQTSRVEAFYDAISDSIQSEIDAFDAELDALKTKADQLKDKADELQDAADDQEDSLNDIYDAAQSYYDMVQDNIDAQIDAQDELIAQNDARIDALNEQKDAIQAQIDALDDAADSESKLLALEEAREALENARNSKTRMVLTNGGGWRMRTDKSAWESAQSNYASAQTDYQKELLERQQDALEDQIDELEKQNDQIETIKDDLEDQKDAIDEIKDQWSEAQENLGKTTSELEKQTNLLNQFASMSNQQRSAALGQFQQGVSTNNQLNQNAADASNAANQASDYYDQQSNENVADTIAAKIADLETLQNQACEAYKQYFENLLSCNAEQIQIEQEAKNFVESLVGTSQGQLEQFAAYLAGVNSAYAWANEQAASAADFINNMSNTIELYETWSNTIDNTSAEIANQAQQINGINSATLASLMEGGATFQQLNDQYQQIIQNNQKAQDIEGQIQTVEGQITDVENQITLLKDQENAISNQISAATNNAATAAKDAGTTASSGAKSAGASVSSSLGDDLTLINKAISKVSGDLNGCKTAIVGEIESQGGKIVSAINNKDLTVNVSVSGGGGGNTTHAAAKSRGGPVGFSTGGVDDFTSLVQVHGTKNRPELVLNNSQSAALFKYIDSMTRIPTLPTAGSARNALQGIGSTNQTINDGTTFTNCEINVTSNADSLDSLVRDLKQSVSIRR